MNFLAHFLLAAHQPSSEFHLGSILPDIARRAGLKIHPQVFQADDSEPAGHHELKTGIFLHWKADARFHNHALFRTGCQAWKEVLDPLIPEVHRRFFLYHLLAEMWLDRLLLMQNGDSAAQLYASVRRVEPGLLHAFSRRLGDHQLKLLHTLDDFHRRRFLLDYADPDHFAAIASGVFSHGSRQLPDPVLRKKIGEVLPELNRFEEDLLLRWVQFSKEIHSSSAGIETD